MKTMKRLVIYDDEDDNLVPNQLTTSSSSVLNETLPSVTEAPKKNLAQAIFLEKQSFENSFRKGEGEYNSSIRRKDKSTVTITDVGNARRDGPWAPVNYEEEEEKERIAWEQELERRRQEKLKEEENTLVSTELISEPPKPTTWKAQKSERFGTKMADYQGRSFIDSRRWPAQLEYMSDDDEDNDDETKREEVEKYVGKRSKINKRKDTKIPKQTSGPSGREYVGHTMGINKVRLFGCLALTASMDGTVLIWDTALPTDITNATHSELADSRGAIQSYWGHDGESVKDCAFLPNSAEQFASCGYDGYACLWDTETGEVIRRFRDSEAIGGTNAVRFKPDDESQLLTACGDRRLRHWDVRENRDKPSQTYDFHQSSVNSATFCEHGKKFVSTSDDRKLLVWDWGVPSPVKIISEVWLPSMPTTATHPGSMSFVSVGLDNKLYYFQVNESTGVVKKHGEYAPEGFRVSGYSCEPAYSHSGKYLACGDGAGDIIIFKPKAYSSGIHRISGAHVAKTPVSCVQFHPCFEGVLISVGWDGKMKWWS